MEFEEEEMVTFKSRDYEVRRANLWKMRNEFCDVTLICCDNEKIPAHKIILASSSKFFHNSLVLSDELKLTKVDRKSMESLLQFIYTGLVMVPASGGSKLIELAKTLMIEGFEANPRKKVENNDDGEAGKALLRSASQTREDFESGSKTTSELKLENLPCEMILNILKKVPQSDLLKNVSKVSKMFCNLAKDCSVHFNILLTDRIQPASLQSLVNHRSHQIYSLELSNCSVALLRMVQSNFGLLKNLTSISISYYSLINYLPTVFSTLLFVQCQSLKKFRVCHCQVEYEAVGHCKQLESFEDHSNQLNIHSFHSLLSLRHLRMLHVSLANEISLEDFNGEWMAAEDLSKLSKLTLEKEILSGQCLKTIARMSPNLDFFEVCFKVDRNISATSVRQFLATLKKLRCLTFTAKNYERGLTMQNFKAEDFVDFEMIRNKSFLIFKRKQAALLSTSN